MKKLIMLLVGLSLAGLAGCGPSTSVTTMKTMPARADDCSLKFVDIDFSRLNVDKEWTVVGYVTIGDDAEGEDPLSGKYRDLVRPRACELGGEAVTLATGAANQYGSATNYAVLIPYEEGGHAEPVDF